MKCPEFHERLQNRLDGYPVADTEWQRHLADCLPCRRLHAAARRLEAGLRVLPPSAPRSDLTDRIVAAVLAARRARLRFCRRLLVATSLAAGLLLAVAGYAWVRAHPGASPAKPSAPPPVVRGPAAPKDVPPPGEPAASLNESVEEAGSAVVSLTRRAAGETVDPARMLLPRSVPSPTLGEGGVLPRDLVAGRPAQSLEEARHGMSSGIEPVTTSARRAVDLFLNELPPMEPEQKRGL